MRFVIYLAIAHQQRAPDMKAEMQTRGGYICHLDATCEGGDPFLMSSIDSLSEIVLGNIKLPSEDQAHIVPFLVRIQSTFDVPVALVHDMGKGILAEVAKVFPGVPDFICHFHFLRDIGKDLFGTEYGVIRKRLGKHGISTDLRYRAKQLKTEMDANPAMIKALQEAMANGSLAHEAFEFTPVVAAYTLIQWALKGKPEGDGYGFPFDRPHLTFARRLRHLNLQIERIQEIYLRGQCRDNGPYFKIHIALNPLMKESTLWKAQACEPTPDRQRVLNSYAPLHARRNPTGPKPGQPRLYEDPAQRKAIPRSRLRQHRHPYLAPRVPQSSRLPTKNPHRTQATHRHIQLP